MTSSRILALALALGSVRTASAQTAVVYDGYIAGVKAAELTVRGAGPHRSVSIRKRDLARNRWSPPHTAPESAVAADTAFALWGAVKELPAQLGALARLPWTAVTALGWPGPEQIYVRHDSLTATVGGRPVTATRWAARDASRPLDLIVTRDNRVVAGIDPGRDLVLVERGYEGFTTVARWRDPHVSQPDYGYRGLGKQMVPMTDGVKLATLVYLPDGNVNGPFPVILIRAPYGISTLIESFWHYAARGYAVVLQAVRGTSYWDPSARSEGTWDPMINEPRDGAATLEWIVKQPWSNGKICMQGGSYVGYTQWTASMARNPALKCLVPESSMGTAFSDQPFMGGSFVEGMAYYMFFMLDRPVLADRSWTEILHHRPLIDLDRFATGKDIPQWKTMLSHTSNDDYWKPQNWYAGDYPREFNTLQISGWFDDDFPGTESNWALMRRSGRGPQRLIIGPWKHGYNADRALNGMSFGTGALRDDIWLVKQQWYDRFLKGIENGVERPVVQYFMLGANQWRTASQWPPEEIRTERWYFHSDGQANRLLTAGELTQAPPAGVEPADGYRYDPRYPPPNWMSFDQMLRWEDVQTFPWDFKDIESRPDVVTFTSAPLDRDLAVAGDIGVVLYASTDVRDTDWWIHVSDVDPAGRSIRLTTGMLRARYRHLEDPVHHSHGSNFEREELLSGNPEEIVRYDIGVRSIANTFKRGHRIRVAIMNALDNYSFPNSNTGQDEARVTETVVGTMGIHHTAQHPSHILLPVLPH
jgi:putative CocE/NonD family hydrolase